MEPINFFYFAQDLLRQYKSEVAFRTAVNRGYYGMILYLRNEIQDIIGKEIGAGLHNYIPACLRYAGASQSDAHKIPTATSLAHRIDGLKKIRHDADYKTTIIFEARTAQIFLPMCLTAMHNFNQLMESEHKELVKIRIKKYSEMRPPS